MNGVEEDFDAIIMATGYASTVSKWLKVLKLTSTDNHIRFFSLSSKFHLITSQVTLGATGDIQTPGSCIQCGYECEGSKPSRSWLHTGNPAPFIGW